MHGTDSHADTSPRPALRCVALLVWLLAGASLAAEPLVPFSNEYRARARGIPIAVTHELKPLDDGIWEMRFHARAWVGNVEEVSHLRLDEEGRVVPLHYTYRRRGMGRNRTGEIAFDWKENSVHNVEDDEDWELEITENVQDRLSFQLQMQRDIIAGRDKLVYHIADGSRMREYGFEVVGEETIDTPLGKVKTVKVKRSREGSSRVTYAWLAPEFDHLLVRLQQDEGSSTYTLNIDKAQVDGKAIDRF